MPSEAGEETETHRHTGGDRLRHLDQTLANIGRLDDHRIRMAANSLDRIRLWLVWRQVGWRERGIRGLRGFDIGGPYREDARCFRAEAISSCAVVLTLTAAETRLTERSSVWRRRGTVTYHLENRGGEWHRDVAIQLLFPLFHHRCLLMWLESGVQRLIGFLSLPCFLPSSFCVFDLLLRSLSNLIVAFAGLLRGCWSYFGIFIGLRMFSWSVLFFFFYHNVSFVNVMEFVRFRFVIWEKFEDGY